MMLESQPQTTLKCRHGLENKSSLVSNHLWVSLVPSEFVNDFADGRGAGYNNHPAWFVDISKDEFTIIKQESGMDPLAVLSKTCKDLKVIE